MWFGRKKPKRDTPGTPGTPDFGNGQDPRRTKPRHSGEAIACVLGEVIDVSADGVRVRCKGKPPFSKGALLTIELTFQGGNLQVSVQERWRKHRGLRGYEIGLKFVSNSPKVMTAIDSLATFGFIDTKACAQSGPTDEPKPKSKPKIRAMVDLPDYYAALGVSPEADADQLQSAYRKLARLYHPDTSEDPDSDAKFIEVCEAYKVLSDTQQRKSYDLRQAG